MSTVDEKSLPTFEPVSLDTILRRSMSAEQHGGEPDFGRRIDRSRWFICPTLTPLFYTDIYRDLSDDQQRRYNQLTALCFNELISFFEEGFAGSVLSAMTEVRHQRIEGPLEDCLRGFLEDERRHQDYWRRLSLLTEPDWYAKAARSITQFSPLATRLMRTVASRPRRFTAVFWVMLALEERSLDISRRCLNMVPNRGEPTYRSVYAQHLRDESRHVELDCHLIDRFYATQSLGWRRINARLLAVLLSRFFLPPSRSGVRVVKRLAAEDPTLADKLPAMVLQLRQVGQNENYQEMMYSRPTTPRLFALLDRFPEMHIIETVLRTYRPATTRFRTNG